MTEQEVKSESATIYELHALCPLCGGRLIGQWDDAQARRCKSCGAHIRVAVDR